MVDREYYKLPFIKRIWYKIYDAITLKIKSFKFSWIKLTIFVVIVAILVTTFLIIFKGKITFPTKDPYDKTGFVDASETEISNIVLENNDYSFTLNGTDTSIRLLDKRNGITYTSVAPEKSDEARKKDTLIVYYKKGLTVPQSLGNYDNSIKYNGIKRFMVRTSENSVEVLYKIGGKIKTDYTDLPQLISKERYDKFIGVVKAHLETLDKSSNEYKTLNKSLKIVSSSYSYNEVYNYYALVTASAISENYILSIYDVLYNQAGYTTNDLLFDNSTNNIEITKTYPTFEVSMKYTLTDKGLQVSIVNDSIVDYESEPLVYIDVLPYFGVVSSNEQGYAMIPDGSGVILDFNSSRSYANSYKARIYGNDLAKVINVKQPSVDIISLPLYGICVNNATSSNGFINVIEDGAECAELLASINTKSTQYDEDDNITKLYCNSVYYRYYYRETDTYTFTSLAKQNDIESWTNQYNPSNFDFVIMPLANDASYSSMAHSYQDYLISKGILTKKDLTKHFNLELIGGYLREESFLGIPYDKVSALTSSSDVLSIATLLKNKSVDNVNLIYSGAINSGIKQTYLKKFNYSSDITSFKKLNKLTSDIKALDYNLSLNLNVASCYSLNDVNNDYLIKDQYGKLCPYYDVNEATYLLDKTTTPKYYLLPETFNKTANTINKELTKLKMDTCTISDLGNRVYGSYKSKNTIFRGEVINSFTSVMDNILHDYQVQLSYPYDYALKYTDLALNIPFSGTNYQTVKASIPFYQLVVAGCIEYSSLAINLLDDNSFDYYKMKMLETSSSIYSSWTGRNTTDLFKTEYDNLYSTYYVNWLDKTVDLYNDLSSIKAYNSYLVNHSFLDANCTVSKVDYASNAQIIFNYSNEPYTYGLNTINPNSYLVVEVGE